MSANRFEPEDDGFPARVASMRPRLMQVARKRTSNPVWAEDAVSETLLAALESRGQWRGEAGLEPWLVGILKHKLVDQLRAHLRFLGLDDLLDEGLDGLPDECPEPSRCGDPLAAMERQRARAALILVHSRLSSRHAAVLEARHLLEESSADVSRRLRITENHCNVIAHRARSFMRRGLAELGISPVA